MASLSSTSTAPPEMRAWQLHGAAPEGIQKGMQLNKSAKPPSWVPKEGQAVIRVLSISVNPVDYSGPELPLLGKLITKNPTTPCKDFCGQVVAVGNNDRGIETGNLVYGTLSPLPQYGTLVDYTVSPLDSLSRLPPGVAVDEAAAVPTVGLTAYQSIVPHVTAGNKVFINGGSGGTGTFGIQIAKLLGCHVTTSCSTANVDFCKELGADEVIDYKKTDVAEALKAKGPIFDLAVDNIGVPYNLYWAANSFLNEKGRYNQVGVSISGSGLISVVSRSLWPGFLGGGKRKFQFISVVANGDQLHHLAQWMSEGKLRSIIDSRFSFEDANKAFERLKTKRARGKIVISINKTDDV